MTRLTARDAIVGSIAASLMALVIFGVVVLTNGSNDGARDAAAVSADESPTESDVPLSQLKTPSCDIEPGLNGLSAVWIRSDDLGTRNPTPATLLVQDNSGTVHTKDIAVYETDVPLVQQLPHSRYGADYRGCWVELGQGQTPTDPEDEAPVDQQAMPDADLPQRTDQEDNNAERSSENTGEAMTILPVIGGVQLGMANRDVVAAGLAEALAYEEMGGRWGLGSAQSGVGLCGTYDDEQELLEGSVETVYVTAPLAWSTPEGIGPGSTIDAVDDAYPTAQLLLDQGTFKVYGAAQGAFGYQFHMDDGVVSGIMVGFGMGNGPGARLEC